MTARFPLYGFGWMMLGIALKQIGLAVDALTSMEKAAALSPNNLEVLNNLGNILQDMGRFGEAEATFLKALQVKPNFAEAHSNLGNILKCMGRLSEAEASFQRALQINPNFADAHYNLGNVLKSAGRLDEAEASFRKALQLNPSDIEAYNNLGLVLEDMGRLDGAETNFRKALQTNPNFAEAHYNLGNIFRNVGRLEEAEVSYRRALQINPDYPVAHSNLLLTHNYMSGIPADMLLAESQRFGAMVARHARPYTDWSNIPGLEKCLRVGFVSGDLRNHSVGYFVESVMRELASNFSSSLELFAYPTHSYSDALTERIKACCHGWYSSVGLSDEMLARRIREDGIDILIDLSGHTAHNRLPLFAWKPAPIQASWLGYCATTGVAEIDYYIADTCTLPVEQESQFSENIWRLPESYLCFSRPATEVAVSPLPALTTGYITFGSFNNLTKMTEEVITLWARILHAIPNSRLLLKSKQLTDITVCERTRAQYVAHGIAAERLELTSYIAERGGHLGAYNRVDIGLDPFPYNGVTTTIEALWMGVPVLSLAGKRFLARQGVGILSNAGLSEWIARDSEELIVKAVARARDLESLSRLRVSLRERLETSVLFDAPCFATHFEAGLRGMWSQWCNQQKYVGNP